MYGYYSKSVILTTNFFLFSESRPARKDYNKLTGDDQHLLQDKEDIHQETSQQSQNEDVKNKHEKLDNETIFRDELTNNELIETDSESTFTDIDLDRDDFTDDSDYGMLIIKLVSILQEYLLFLLIKIFLIYVECKRKVETFNLDGHKTRWENTLL